MMVRQPMGIVALLGMAACFGFGSSNASAQSVKRIDARYAVADPGESLQYDEIVQDTLAQVAEHLTMLRVSSMTISGKDLTAIAIDAPQTFFSIGMDGRPTLAGMESVTVSGDSIVFVFDRSPEPDGADLNVDLARDTLAEVAENLTTLQVTSMTTDGTDITSMGISAKRDLFSVDDDERVALTGIRSVTITDDKLTLVLNRALDTDSDLSVTSLTPVPKTCHMEATPKLITDVDLVCTGTCSQGSCVMGVKLLRRTDLDPDATQAGGGITIFCSCR